MHEPTFPVLRRNFNLQTNRPPQELEFGVIAERSYFPPPRLTLWGFSGPMVRLATFIGALHSQEYQFSIGRCSQCLA
jgi:hypothetical protein